MLNNIRREYIYIEVCKKNIREPNIESIEITKLKKIINESEEKNKERYRKIKKRNLILKNIETSINFI